MMLLPIYFIQTDFREGAFSMDEKQVEVIKKVDGPVIRDRRKMGKPLTITRKRVAAYVLSVSARMEKSRYRALIHRSSTIRIR